MKILTLIAICMVLLIGSVFAYNHFYIKDNKIDCSKPLDVLYLKASELSHASELANKINGIVVIPELNQIIARTDVLDCESFDANDYINLEDKDGTI